MSPEPNGFLGIDLGTQGLSAVYTDSALTILETGTGDYPMLPGLEAGCCEQNPGDWWAALRTALGELRLRLEQRGLCLRPAAIGISGQMHGEVLCDRAGQPLAPARLWCDARNQAEGEELTALFGVKVPKRMTVARWLWTLRQRRELAGETWRLTTPGGWLAWMLTGGWRLGVGDASGMFPVNLQHRGFDADLLRRWEELPEVSGTRPLRELLPMVGTAGEDGGAVTDEAAHWTGLPAGTPVALAEGDQPAAMAGALVGRAGTVAMSFGTSICANSVGDRPFAGVHPAVDHFCAVDGQPINMVLLRNGTAFLSAVVEMFRELLPEGADGFSALMPRLLAAPADCGGLIALPFMDDEPGLGIARGGTCVFAGFNPANARPGNFARAALLATVFNLQNGTDVLAVRNMPIREIVLSGGLTRTPELGQIVADAFGVPVKLRAEGAEGSAWGAALLAAYRHSSRSCSQPPAWQDWLETAIPVRPPEVFLPDQAAHRQCGQLRRRYGRLLEARATLAAALDAP